MLITFVLSHAKLTEIRIGSFDTLQLPYENINKFNLDVDLHLESGYTQNQVISLCELLQAISQFNQEERHACARVLFLFHIRKEIERWILE